MSKTKLRLRLRFSVWGCVTVNPWRTGYGCTRREAYAEWAKHGVEVGV